jgi:hypothetical protein
LDDENRLLKTARSDGSATKSLGAGPATATIQVGPCGGKAALGVQLVQTADLAKRRTSGKQNKESQSKLFRSVVSVGERHRFGPRMIESRFERLPFLEGSQKWMSQWV